VKDIAEGDGEAGLEEILPGDFLRLADEAQKSEWKRAPVENISAGCGDLMLCLLRGLMHWPRKMRAPRA